LLLLLELLKVLNNMPWSKKEEVTGDWRKIPNEELHYLYTRRYLCDPIKEDKMAEACATHMREKINRHKVGAVGAEGRRPFGEDGTIILKWKLKKLNGN